MSGGQFDWGGRLKLVGLLSRDTKLTIWLYAGKSVP
jgi:hypothetical protein